MPGTVKVRVQRARDLPVMNAALTTAFVVLKLENQSDRTRPCSKTLNPVWNQDFRFEVDDEALQDEILLFKLWDYDAMGNHDAIGQVMVDLDVLLKPDAPSQLSGWFPIYDTLRGIRGSLNITVKLDYTPDQNKYRDSSCGVLVFSSTSVPECHKCSHILGFVDELMLKDDPEFQWVDRIRSSSASNEARQAVFAELDGELKRRIGHNAADMGGNAIIGYRQEFDLEGDAMVARGIGTVVYLVENTFEGLDSLRVDSGTSACIDPRQLSGPNAPPPSPWPESGSGHLRSGSFTVDNGSPSTRMSMRSYVATHHNPIDDDVQLITLTSFPLGFLVCLGGIVKACSIKLFEDDKVETRDIWWNELRAEIISHAQILGYSAVIGYSEITSIQDGVCLLSAIGTTAMTNPDFNNTEVANQGAPPSSSFPSWPYQQNKSNVSGATKVNARGVYASSSLDSNGESHVNEKNLPMTTATPPPTPTLRTPPAASRFTTTAPTTTTTTTIPRPPPPVTPTTTSSTPVKRNSLALSPTATTTPTTTTTSAPPPPMSLSSTPPPTSSTSSPSPQPKTTTSSSSPSSPPNMTLPTPALNIPVTNATNTPPRPLVIEVDSNISNAAHTSTLTGQQSGHTHTHTDNTTFDASSHSFSPHTFGANPTSAVIECPFAVCHLAKSTLGPQLNEFGMPTICKACKAAYVSDITFCTVEPPQQLQIIGSTSFVQARICRQQQRFHGKEELAVQIGDSMPFLEQKLHEQLINKMKVFGANALFNLRMQVSIGDTLLCGVASGTAVYIAALPMPSQLRILRSTEVVDDEDQQLMDLCSKNRQALRDAEDQAISSGRLKFIDAESASTFDLAYADRVDHTPEGDTKRNVAIRIDDETDEDMMTDLLDVQGPQGLFACTTNSLPGMGNFNFKELPGAESITVMKRVHMYSEDRKHLNRSFADIFKQMLEVGWFKLRHLKPCVFSNVRFDVQLPDENEILVTMIGMAVPLTTKQDNDNDNNNGHNHNHNPVSSATMSASENDDDPMFFLEEDLPVPTKSKEKPRMMYGDEEDIPLTITPMTHVPGCTVKRHLGILSLYLIRETTSLRQEGGVAQFLQTFLSEVHAIVKAHILSRGGNALVSYRLKQPVLLENEEKNQGQSLLSVTGDVVEVVSNEISTAAKYMSPQVSRHTSRRHQHTSSRLPRVALSNSFASSSPSLTSMQHRSNTATTTSATTTTATATTTTPQQTQNASSSNVPPSLSFAF